MADTLTEFDPTKAGFRMASGPITRKPRQPSARPGPKPQYADAVWFTFQREHPLEAVVGPRSVEGTIRKLKQAARYLERNHPGTEVRVQISVEAEMADGEPGADGEPTKVPTGKSVVKFLGHPPWNLGRRVAKLASENGHADAEPEPEVERPRRTVAAVRPAPRRARGTRRRKP
jgi:hypothetical protein